MRFVGDVKLVQRFQIEMVVVIVGDQNDIDGR